MNTDQRGEYKASGRASRPGRRYESPSAFICAILRIQPHRPGLVEMDS